MAAPLMAPRSYDYSGEADPRDARAYGVSMGSEPVQADSNLGFLGRLNDIAGKLAPIVEAAVAFKQGYQGYPLPGRGVDDPRMAGDRFIFQVLEDMRARNEQSEERARIERESARESDLRQRLILAGVEKGDISWKEALEALKTGGFESIKPQDRLPSQAPAPGAPQPK